MAGRAKENFPRGSLKYLFVNIKIRIFKCSYRIYILYIDIYIYMPWNIRSECMHACMHTYIHTLIVCKWDRIPKYTGSCSQDQAKRLFSSTTQHKVTGDFQRQLDCTAKAERPQASTLASKKRPRSTPKWLQHT